MGWVSGTLGPPPSLYILFLQPPPTSFLFLPATPPSSQTSSQLVLPPPKGSQMTNQYIHEEISMLFCSEKFHGGGWVTLQLSEPADFKNDPDFENCQGFVGVIKQIKI